VSSSVTTILFTDIEGSTRLWEQEGDRMSAALAKHDAFARAAVDSNHGVVVKMTGDGLYAAFDDPLEAVYAAIMLQQSLADPAQTSGIALRVRCGLHLGVVERRDNDYFGSAVNRTARLMSAAHGGQVLLSQSVVDFVRDRLPLETSLRDLGGVRLRDLATPEHVYQLLHPKLRQDFPALRSLEATPNNLPQQVTSFIGRERELMEAKELLAHTRLLTLHGMGGLGKTRLSMQIGADVMDAYPDGVWFVDLAPIVDPALVPETAAQVLGVREEPGKSITQTLGSHLKERKLLLILDNCEHLMGACATLANTLLRGTPDVRILATTREALRVPGEQTYPVLPLAVPDKSASIDTLTRTEAVQLFMERARLQKPGFALTERDAPAVAELCARLEGIPLALELAAARVRSLSVQDINARLSDRFKLLTAGARVHLARQQTLRALVAWSYDLLTENEQLLFERLSVFVGGFDLTATEDVCGIDPLLAEDILDLLTSLVEKSLVMVEQGDDGSRFRQLETIREFAREYLQKRDGVAATAARHCDYYFRIAKTAKVRLRGPEQAEAIRQLEAELDNIRAAIALALAGGVPSEIAVKLEVALMRFRVIRGYSTEGRNDMRAALALPSVREQPAVYAHGLYVGGVLADAQSDYAEAKRLLTECLMVRRSLGDPKDIAATLSTLAVSHFHEGDLVKARECDEEALAIFKELGDRVGEAIGLIHLGEISVELDLADRAQEYFEQALTLARALKDQELESHTERFLGQIALERGNLKAARARLERSLAVCRDAEDKRGEATTLWWLGKADAASGDRDSARKKLADSVRAFQALEMNAEVLDSLEDCAELLQDDIATAQAVAVFAAASAARETLTLRRSARSELHRRQRLDAARAALGNAAFENAWSTGHVWRLDEAIHHALDAALASKVTA